LTLLKKIIRMSLSREKAEEKHRRKTKCNERKEISL
jgi:hypothetical protein